MTTRSVFFFRELQRLNIIDIIKVLSADYLVKISSIQSMEIIIRLLQIYRSFCYSLELLKAIFYGGLLSLVTDAIMKTF